MMELINLTPHTINICGGKRLEASGYLVRLQMKYEQDSEVEGIVIEKVKIGRLIITKNGKELSPEEAKELKGKIVIVPALVALQAGKILKQELGVARVLSPATDKANRDEKGRILCVPGLIELSE